MSPRHRIAVVGGTGAQGKGLAYRFVKAGHEVVIGSRERDRAEAIATEISAKLGRGQVQGATNESAVSRSEVVVLAVPYAGHAAVVRSLSARLAGKVLVSCVNPIKFDAGGPYGQIIDGGSAAEVAQILAPGVAVTGAFHHVSAINLWEEDDGRELIEEDVLVCGDDIEAKKVTMELARAISGRPGIDVGPLRLAAQLEAFTAVLISLNKIHKVHSGLVVSGLEGHR